MRCQLWIRLHPQAVTGPYKLHIDPYRSLASERVKVEFPPVRDSKLPWELPKSDLEHLVKLLRDADVVINTASTLSVDAAVLDRPVVCIAYDPAGSLPYHRSVRRYYDFTHMKNVVQLGAAQLATSPEALRKKIVTYLEQPELDRDGRRRIVEQQFGRVDGLSAARLVDQIVALISKGKTK
jgi:CDP-glycerol glycerophosphotransferase (TagB/SpsB family)